MCGVVLYMAWSVGMGGAGAYFRTSRLGTWVSALRLAWNRTLSARSIGVAIGVKFLHWFYQSM